MTSKKTGNFLSDHFNQSTAKTLKRSRPPYVDVINEKSEFQSALDLRKQKIQDQDVPSEVKMRQLTALDLKSKQLDTLEFMLNTSLIAMRQLLSQRVLDSPSVSVGDDPTSPENVDSSIEELLSEIQQQNQEIMAEMQSTAFQAQLDYKQSVEKIKEAQSDTKKTDVPGASHTLTGDIVDGVMGSLEGSVEQLEKSIQDNEAPVQQQQGKLETVVKVMDDDDDDVNPSSNTSGTLFPHKQGEVGNGNSGSSTQASTIIDTSNNRYVLSRSSDPTEFSEDFPLFFDLVHIIGASFVMGLIFESFRLPSFLGQICSGMLLGPAGMNQIRSVIQIETLAQFGVLLILYVLGLEFSVDRLQKYWRIAVIGGLSMILASIVASAFLGLFTTLSMNTILFVGAVISLSSTTVLLKCFRHEDYDSQFGNEVLGILVVQDVFLGLMLALMPVLKNTGLQAAGVALGITLKLGIFASFAYVFHRIFAHRIYRILRKFEHADLQLLGLVAVCFGFIEVCFYRVDACYACGSWRAELGSLLSWDVLLQDLP